MADGPSVPRSQGAVQAAEARQRDPSMGGDVPVSSPVHAFHQVLLVEQWVVGAECACRIVEALVVVTQLRLPAGRQELVHVHDLAQRHHEHRAWPGREAERSVYPLFVL